MRYLQLALSGLIANGRSITFGLNGVVIDLPIINFGCHCDIYYAGFFSADALEDGFVLPEAVLASVSLPPSLFATIEDRDPVGVFFALYESPTLFPVREEEQVSELSFRPAVASSVVAATVGPGLDFSDLDPPVEINLRIVNDFGNFVSDPKQCLQ